MPSVRSTHRSWSICPTYWIMPEYYNVSRCHRRVIVDTLPAKLSSPLTPLWCLLTIASTEAESLFAFIRGKPRPRGSYENAYRRWLVVAFNGTSHAIYENGHVVYENDRIVHAGGPYTG